MRSRPFVRAISLAVLALALAGCGKKSVTGPGDTGTLLAQANQELEATLATLMNAPAPERPSDVDFSSPLAKYEQVLASDPANATANFGAGVLGVLAITYDSEVNAAFDEWSAYLAEHTPFESGTTAMRPLGIPAFLTPGRAAYALPFAIVPITPLATLRATRVATHPQIGRVQDILRNRVLPKLQLASTRLGRAAARPGFHFTVTPGMQGDPGASPVELDAADVLALKAGVDLLAAACHAAVAYDLGFASLDSTGLVNAIRPGGNWLRLRSDGAAQMAGARASLLACADDVDASLASLAAETDPQDDDFIKGIPADAADSVRSATARVRTGLTSGYGITADWDGTSATPPTNLTIRFDRLFTNPVADWKAILPDYSVSTELRLPDGNQAYEYGTSQQTAEIPIAGYYSNSYYLWNEGGQWFEQIGILDSLITPLRAAAWQQVQRIEALPGYGGSCFVSTFFSGTLNAGAQSLAVSWDAYYITGRPLHVPVITWTADSYAQWTWNVDALHGLFPDIHTSDQLLSTFGYDPSSWTKTVVLDWTQVLPGPALRVRAPALRRPPLASVRRLP